MLILIEDNLIQICPKYFGGRNKSHWGKIPPSGGKNKSHWGKVPPSGGKNNQCWGNNFPCWGRLPQSRGTNNPHWGINPRDEPDNNSHNLRLILLPEEYNQYNLSFIISFSHFYPPYLMPKASLRDRDVFDM